MPKQVKNTITGDADSTTTLMEFPSGLTVASSLIDRTWTITAGGEVRTGEISADDDLLGMPHAVGELGSLTAEKSSDANERDDSVEVQYWGRLNFDLGRFLAYMSGKIPHPDVLPYPPENVDDDTLILGALAVAALSLPRDMAAKVIDSVAERAGVDLSEVMEFATDDDEDDENHGFDPDWKPEGWDL